MFQNMSHRYSYWSLCNKWISEKLDLLRISCDGSTLCVSFVCALLADEKACSFIQWQCKEGAALHTASRCKYSSGWHTPEHHHSSIRTHTLTSTLITMWMEHSVIAECVKREIEHLRFRRRMDWGGRKDGWVGVGGVSWLCELVLFAFMK